ncbi:trimethyllysine dioxygenase, mitochondrial [Maniola jurtina]|uniref:trimethyllysine dioxygenase, mitochondrial n=1 Tax=Maniola jurtina TaxID=191418 RepID=UPI001E68AFED|nr:trimethyllysine dioxygenase, mitochondrial [Maniola jurtina]
MNVYVVIFFNESYCNNYSVSRRMSALQSVNIEDRALKVLFDDGTSLVFEDCWLRDHCRCSTCYRTDTFQRTQHILDIPDATINSVEFDRTEILIKWNDNHESIYKSEFLSEFDYKTWTNQRRSRPLLWRGKEVANKVAKVHVDKFLDSVEGAKAVFTSLVDYGVALIEGVGVSLEATETVCKALGGIQHTMFGGMWTISNLLVHADTAYSNVPLAVHNDNTYFNEAAGLQVFHCLEHSNGTGGETILMDGFYGASQLKKEFPEDYEFLTTFEVEAEYLEDGHNFRYAAPVIQVDKLKDLQQIRFNVYDRSAMAFSSREECRAYYRSLRNLSRYYENPECQWKFKLVPGLMVAFDNFRLLHGRTGFTGNRVLCGSYVARSEWLDKARALGAIR